MPAIFSLNAAVTSYIAILDTFFIPENVNHNVTELYVDTGECCIKNLQFKTKTAESSNRYSHNIDSTINCVGTE